ncbi:hypothetical protein ACTXT7_004888 [Hymenolepis weldensis]
MCIRIEKLDIFLTKPSADSLALQVSEFHYDKEADQTFANWVGKCEDVFQNDLADFPVAACVADEDARKQCAELNQISERGVPLQKVKPLVSQVTEPIAGLKKNINGYKNPPKNSP